jgi:hypothetical protein
MNIDVIGAEIGGFTNAIALEQKSNTKKIQSLTIKS